MREKSGKGEERESGMVGNGRGMRRREESEKPKAKGKWREESVNGQRDRFATW